MESFKRSLEIDKEKIEIEDGLDLYKEDVAKEKKEYLDNLDKIIENLLQDYGNLFDKEILSFTNQVKLEIFNRLIETDTRALLIHMDSFGILPEEYQSKIYNLLKNSNWGLFSMDRLLKAFDKITNQELSSWCLSPDRKWDFQIIAKNKEKFPLASDEDILSLATEKGSSYFSKDWNSIITVLDKFPHIKKEDVIEGIFKMPVNNNPGIVVDNYEKLGLSQRELLNLFFEKKLSYKLIDKIDLISVEYHQEITEKAIEEGSAWDVLDAARKIKNVDIQEVIQKILAVTNPEKGSGKTGIQLIINRLNALPQDWLDRIDRVKIIDILIENKNIELLLKNLDQFYVEIKDNPDYILKILNTVDLKFLRDNTSEVLKLLSKFNLNLDSLNVCFSEKQTNDIERLEQVIPDLRTKIFSSFEILDQFLSLDTDKIDLLISNSLLHQSFKENPSMAIKLLVQYPKFSESPRENIDFILEAKQRILEHNPNIDSNSHEFRLLIQEQLKPYKRNKDMLAQMAEEGINVDEWLNYSEETLFELGGEETSYAELIKLPSERIQKILQKYEEEIKTALSKYKKELLTKEVSLVDTVEIEEKIKQMEQLAQESTESGNQGKAQGIQKGIEGLKKQIENSKMIPAWLKIMSDIDTVSKLFTKVNETNTRIASLDAELTTFAKNPSKGSQKKMFENKKKIKELSIEFVSLLGITSTRMDSLLLSIQNSLSQTLGKDISEELISKLNTDLSEDQEHFNSDKATLQNILKLHESEDDVRGTFLKIKVWDRNPDIDLYQGNYSDCCVRIDSEYHGSKSPISDYLTDLGIQIVAVYNEKTGKPFATAWCFVGEDEQGNKAFVIDNIEASGPCMQYKDDIKHRMKDYIEQYANASGLEIISQGPYNNDVVIARLGERYNKLGGYNKKKGYYLEAEPDGHVWEEDLVEDYNQTDREEIDGIEELEDDFFEEDTQSAQKELDEIEEQRLINEYTRTQENIVSLEEALNRARNI